MKILRQVFVKTILAIVIIAFTLAAVSCDSLSPQPTNTALVTSTPVPSFIPDSTPTPAPEITPTAQPTESIFGKPVAADSPGADITMLTESEVLVTFITYSFRDFDFDTKKPDFTYPSAATYIARNVARFGLGLNEIKQADFRKLYADCFVDGEKTYDNGLIGQKDPPHTETLTDLELPDWNFVVSTYVPYEDGAIELYGEATGFSATVTITKNPPGSLVPYRVIGVSNEKRF